MSCISLWKLSALVVFSSFVLQIPLYERKISVCGKVHGFNTNSITAFNDVLVGFFKA